MMDRKGRPEPVAVIGLGAMGLPMARALLLVRPQGLFGERIQERG